MHRIFILLATLLLAALLAGCGAKAYRIKTISGQEYIANGIEYNVKLNTYTFTNNQGEEVVINKDDIQYIKGQ